MGFPGITRKVGEPDVKELARTLRQLSQILPGLYNYFEHAEANLRSAGASNLDADGYQQLAEFICKHVRDNVLTLDAGCELAAEQADKLLRAL